MSKVNEVVFEQRPFNACIELCQKIDKLCFPEEMWLTDKQIMELSQANAQAIVLIQHGEEIGLAILISEIQAKGLLEKADIGFIAREDGIYSYSEAITPEYQKSGLGIVLLCEIMRLIKTQGFQWLSAHVRTIHGWDKGRNTHLEIHETRVVDNFWNDPMEIVRYQSARV